MVVTAMSLPEVGASDGWGYWDWWGNLVKRPGGGAALVGAGRLS